MLPHKMATDDNVLVKLFTFIHQKRSKETIHKEVHEGGPLILFFTMKDKVYKVQIY